MNRKQIRICLHQRPKRRAGKCGISSFRRRDAAGIHAASKAKRRAQKRFPAAGVIPGASGENELKNML
jgi:hypothetical protein